MSENPDVIPALEPEEISETDKAKEIRAVLEDNDTVNGEHFAKAYGKLDSYLEAHSKEEEVFPCYPVSVTRNEGTEMMLAIPTSTLGELDALMMKVETAKHENPKLGKLNFHRVADENINALVITYGEAPEEGDARPSSIAIRAGIEKAERESGGEVADVPLAA